MAHVPQDDNHLYHMMQRRIKNDQERSRGPGCTRNLVTLTDPIDRIKKYREQDAAEEREVERKKRWNLNKEAAVAAAKILDEAKGKDNKEKEMTQVKLQLKLNQTKAMSVLSACDSKIDMMNP